MIRLRFFITICLAPALILMLALVPVAGCGKKAPPKAPKNPGQAVAIPTDPVATLEGARLTLSWSHAVDPEHAVMPPQYFEVSMAIPENCEGCPFVFKTVGRVSMPDMTFQVRIDDGRRRYFRVQAVGGHDTRSDYSRTVMVGVP